MARVSPGVLWVLALTLSTGCLADAADPASDDDQEQGAEPEVDDDDLETTSQLVKLDDLNTIPDTGGYATSWNANGQAHDDVFINFPAGKVIPLRYADGKPTGSVLDASKQQIDELHFDIHEFLETPGGRLMAFHRGGSGHPDLAVKYGHVSLRDLGWDKAKIAEFKSKISDKSKYSSSGEEANGQKGKNGKPCKTVSKGLWQIDVQELPDPGTYWGMHYWKSDHVPGELPTNHDDSGDVVGAGNDMNGYSSYGDPGGQFYDANDPFKAKNAAPGRYTYLNWSWVNTRGGGMVRSLIAQGTYFRRCTNVPRVLIASVDKWGHKNGWVMAVYGRISQGKRSLYGWTTFAHRYWAPDPGAPPTSDDPAYIPPRTMGPVIKHMKPKP